jgi:hypothetical protein
MDDGILAIIKVTVLFSVSSDEVARAHIIIISNSGLIYEAGFTSCR